MLFRIRSVDETMDNVILIKFMRVIATGFVTHSRFSIEEEWPCRTAGTWSRRFNDEQVYMGAC